MAEQKGTFIISLDFELYWGVRDKRTIKNYKENLSGARSAVPALLKLFGEYKVHTTWLTAGFLFFAARDELIKGLPDKRPNYLNSNLSPYNHINNIGANEEEDPFHYAASLIKTIASFPNQEIGSHTFSHYFCLEKGQDIEAFKDDLEAGIKAAKRFNISLESLAFPKNQFNDGYISICKRMGIKAYRGNESHWIYRTRSEEDESLLRRGLRFADTYFNISGHNAYSMDTAAGDFPFNIPSSRFLRPYSNILRILEPLRLQRILTDLTHTAKNGLIYHLWWHPHDFGVNLDENLSFLKEVLEHYLNLQETYGMESLNMGELSHRLMGKTNYEK